MVASKCAWRCALLLVASSSIAAGVVAAGAAADGPVLNPANGHWYEAVTVAQSLYWDDARAAATARMHRGMRGHLVTLTSEEEQRFVAGHFPEAIHGEFYLGASQQVDSAAPAAGWRWVTGEPWRYTFWAPREPNDANEGESRLSFTRHSREGGWNDVPAARFPVKGYVVEYEPLPPNPARTSVPKGVPPRLPDLTAVWQSLDQKSTGSGVRLQAVLRGELIVRNAGRARSIGSRVRFFLLPEGGGPGQLLQEVSLRPLGPGQSHRVRLSAPLPRGASAVGRTVSAVVNPTGGLREVSQENNKALRTVP